MLSSARGDRLLPFRHQGELAAGLSHGFDSRRGARARCPHAELRIVGGADQPREMRPARELRRMRRAAPGGTKPDAVSGVGDGGLAFCEHAEEGIRAVDDGEAIGAIHCRTNILPVAGSQLGPPLDPIRPVPACPLQFRLVRVDDDPRDRQRVRFVRFQWQQRCNQQGRRYDADDSQTSPKRNEVGLLFQATSLDFLDLDFVDVALALPVDFPDPEEHFDGAGGRIDFKDDFLPSRGCHLPFGDGCWKLVARNVLECGSKTHPTGAAVNIRPGPEAVVLVGTDRDRLGLTATGIRDFQGARARLGVAGDDGSRLGAETGFVPIGFQVLKAAVLDEVAAGRRRWGWRSRVALDLEVIEFTAASTGNESRQLSKA